MPHFIFLILLLHNNNTLLTSPYYAVTGSQWSKLSQKVNLCSNNFFLDVTVKKTIIKCFVSKDFKIVPIQTLKYKPTKKKSETTYPGLPCIIHFTFIINA